MYFTRLTGTDRHDSEPGLAGGTSRTSARAGLFFERHQALLQDVSSALAEDEYHGVFDEYPDSARYGTKVGRDGRSAFDAALNKAFQCGPTSRGMVGNETSPYGFRLGISYPKRDLDALFGSIERASDAWKKASPSDWAGVALEILHRLNKRSVEIAHAVMHTSGQPFPMAFREGGPRAQNRGVEAIARAWQAMGQVRRTSGMDSSDAAVSVARRNHIVPRGVGLVIGCRNAPTWSAYLGLFASLTTGNAVVVKPHPAAILPLAITVQTAREVLTEAGFDADIVSLVAHDESDSLPSLLATRLEVGVIDFSGDSVTGNWLVRNAQHATVHTEHTCVNHILIDSTDDFKGMARHIARSLAQYSGQGLGAPQNIYIPRRGIATESGHAGFDEVVEAICDEVMALSSNAGDAAPLLGALQDRAILDNFSAARSLGEVALDSKALAHPEFPEALVHTPMVVKMNRPDSDELGRKFIGPISFCMATPGTSESIGMALEATCEHGAHAWSLYSTSRHVVDCTIDASRAAAVTLSINLTGGEPFDELYSSGGNPASNCSHTDPAFYTARFRVTRTNIAMRSAARSNPPLSGRWQ